MTLRNASFNNANYKYDTHKITTLDK